MQGESDDVAAITTACSGLRALSWPVSVDGMDAEPISAGCVFGSLMDVVGEPDNHSHSPNLGV